MRASIKELIREIINEKRFESNELVVMVFDLQNLTSKKYDFVWVEVDKEFRFNGKMYDVEHKEIKEGKLFLTCYYDHKESILEELFAFYLCKSKKQTFLSHLNFTVLFVDEVSDTKLNNNFGPPLILSSGSDGSISNPVFEVLTPPPQIIT